MTTSMHLSLSHFSVHETTVVHVFFSWNTSFVYREFFTFSSVGISLYTMHQWKDIQTL